MWDLAFRSRCGLAFLCSGCGCPFLPSPSIPPSPPGGEGFDPSFLWLGLAFHFSLSFLLWEVATLGVGPSGGWGWIFPLGVGEVFLLGVWYGFASRPFLVSKKRTARVTTKNLKRTKILLPDMFLCCDTRKHRIYAMLADMVLIRQDAKRDRAPRWHWSVEFFKW